MGWFSVRQGRRYDRSESWWIPWISVSNAAERGPACRGGVAGCGLRREWDRCREFRLQNRHHGCPALSRRRCYRPTSARGWPASKRTLSPRYPRQTAQSIWAPGSAKSTGRPAGSARQHQVARITHHPSPITNQPTPTPAPPRLNGATSRHAGRSRVFRSYVSSPASRWRAVAVLERAAECRLRRVADVLRDERDRKGGVAEQVGGGV